MYPNAGDLAFRIVMHLATAEGKIVQKQFGESRLKYLSSVSRNLLDGIMNISCNTLLRPQHQHSH